MYFNSILKNETKEHLNNFIYVLDINSSICFYKCPLFFDYMGQGSI